MLPIIRRTGAALGVVVLLTLGQGAHAAKFDCSVVYDEFDQLMLARFLVEPDTYVPTLDSLITRTEYLEVQSDRFKLREGRNGSGIGIFRTNRNTSGKMLFIWHEQPSEETIPLIIDENIVFGRVADGYAPQRLKSAYVTPGFAVDLDSGRVVESDDAAADMTYDLIDGEYVIQAINPARIHFPTESMCDSIE